MIIGSLLMTFGIGLITHSMNFFSGNDNKYLIVFSENVQNSQFFILTIDLNRRSRQLYI